MLAAGAAPRLPVAIRIALRDLVRYRARSGAALAATTFAVFLAMGICVVASIRFDSPLNWIGPNLSSSQLLVPTNAEPGHRAVDAAQRRPARQPERAGEQSRRQPARVRGTAGIRVGSLYQVGTPRHGPQNFSGNVYVATPQLLAAYGIKASQIAPGTDFLTMRPGLAGLPHMEMLWHNGAVSDASNPPTPGSDGGPSCTLGNDCVASPPIQTVSALPGGTAAPNTVITEYAVRTYHMQPQLSGWLIQAPAPLTAAQLNAARQLRRPYQVTVEIATYYPSLSDFTDRAIAAGIVIALSVLAMSVGLIRSETAPDLRTLTATGASGATRRAITAATAAALGLLGAILGMAGAVIAGMAWTHSGLTATAGGVPVTDIVILLIGLPLVAAAGGWLLAGREPPAIARQPIE